MNDTELLTDEDRNRAQLVAQALRDWKAELQRQYGPQARVAGFRADKLWAQLDDWADDLLSGKVPPDLAKK